MMAMTTSNSMIVNPPGFDLSDSIDPVRAMKGVRAVVDGLFLPRRPPEGKPGNGAWSPQFHEGSSGALAMAR
jgi:hypothetical protein